MRSSSWTKVVALIVMAVQACAPGKHLSSGKTYEDWYEADERVREALVADLAGHSLRYSTLSARGKGLLSVGEEANFDVRVHSRIIQGQTIWLSVTAALGMEVIRVLITPDSIQILNRGDKEVYQQPFGALRTLSGLELSFAQLENVLVGNMPDQVLPGVIELAPSEAGRRLRPASDTSRVFHFTKDHRLSGFRQGEIKEGGFEVVHAYQPDFSVSAFPSKTSFIIRSPERIIRATIDYDRVVMDEPVDTPFRVPAGYRKMH